MKLTESKLRQIIKEEYEGITIGSMPVGNPDQWKQMSDQLKQMSRIWTKVEDGEILLAASNVLRSAVEEIDKKSRDKLQGKL
jgi:hypothetical protein